MHLLDVRASALAELAPELRGLDEWANPLHECLLRRIHDRDLHAELALCSIDRVLVQVRDDRACARHPLDRDEAVPADDHLRAPPARCRAPPRSPVPPSAP